MQAVSWVPSDLRWSLFGLPAAFDDSWHEDPQDEPEKWRHGSLCAGILCAVDVCLEGL